MASKSSEGFIVNPYETGDSKYHASYGNHNKTVRSFNTLKQAKTYLRNKGVASVLYDAPSGTRDVSTKATATRKRSAPKSRGFFGFRR